MTHPDPQVRRHVPDGSPSRDGSAPQDGSGSRNGGSKGATSHAGVRPPAPVALVAPMRRVLIAGGIASAIALPVSALLGFLVAGVPGAWGALIGMGLAVFFFTVTVAVALATARMDPTKLGVWVLASWLAKVVILIVALSLLRDADFYSRPVLFAALLVGTVASLVLESWVVVHTRVPYVESR